VAEAFDRIISAGAEYRSRIRSYEILFRLSQPRLSSPIRSLSNTERFSVLGRFLINIFELKRNSSGEVAIIYTFAARRIIP